MDIKSKIRIIPAGCDLIEEVADALDDTSGSAPDAAAAPPPRVSGAQPPASRDLSGCLVVFPGRRPSHFLRKSLGARIKTPFIPPAIYSMDEFVDHIYADVLGIADRPVESIDAAAILYEINLQERLGAEGFSGFDAFFPLALDIFNDLEEFMIEQVEVSAVRDIDHLAGDAIPSVNEGAALRVNEGATLRVNGGATPCVNEEAIPEGALKTIKKLSTFYERFYDAVRAHGRSTRSMRYRFVSERIAEAGLVRFKKAVFAGFYALSKSERMIFDEVLRMDNASALFEDGPEGVRPPASMGAQPPASAGARAGTADVGADAHRQAGAAVGGMHPVVRFYKSPDTHGQIFALARHLEDDVIGGVTPDVNGGAPPCVDGGAAPASSSGYGPAPGIDTVIVIPSSEALFPLLRQCLSHFDEADYNVSLGYPLHRTPVYAFLNSLMELVSSMEEGRVYVPAYLKFVLHPYTKNIRYGMDAGSRTPIDAEGRTPTDAEGGALDGPETTRIMFHALEEALVRKRTRGFMSLSEIESLLDDLPAELFGRYGEETSAGAEGSGPGVMLKAHLRDIHQNTVGRFVDSGGGAPLFAGGGAVADVGVRDPIDAGGRTPIADVGDFAAKCAGVLTYIYGAGTARMQPFFHPFVEEFLRHLRLIGRSLLKGMRMPEPSGYFNLFRRYVATARCPFAGTPLGGMQVLGLLETRNLRFRRVFVLDVNEDVLPASKREDSVLPFRARKILGLPTYREREAMAAYYFHTLISGAESVRLYFVENDRRQRSRFIEKLIWERQKILATGARPPASVISDDFVETVQYNIELREKRPEPIEKSPLMASALRQLVYSPSALDAYLRCPLGFYHRYVLGLKEKERMTGDIERADVGLFVHAALAEFFKGRLGRVLSEADLDPDAMDAVVERLFKSSYGEEASGAAVIMKSQVRKHLREFLLKHQAGLAGSCELSVTAVEKTLTSGVLIDAGGRTPITLRGRIDRVERRGGATWIIDYKTSSDPGHLKIDFSKFDLDDRSTWAGAIGTLQLPFYLMLYAGAAPNSADIRDVNAAFILLGRSTFNEKAELALFKEGEDAEARFSAMKTVITGLLGEIIDPDKPFHPAANTGDACRTCSYRPVCGT